MASYDIKDTESCISSNLSDVLSYYDYLMEKKLTDIDRAYWNAALILSMISKDLDIILTGSDIRIAVDYISGRGQYK